MARCDGSSTWATGRPDRRTVDRGAAEVVRRVSARDVGTRSARWRARARIVERPRHRMALGATGRALAGTRPRLAGSSSHVHRRLHGQEARSLQATRRRRRVPSDMRRADTAPDGQQRMGERPWSGGGMLGLAVAQRLRDRGDNVTVFEAAPHPGGVDRRVGSTTTCPGTGTTTSILAVRHPHAGNCCARSASTTSSAGRQQEGPLRRPEQRAPAVLQRQATFAAADRSRGRQGPRRHGDDPGRPRRSDGSRLEDRDAPENGWTRDAAGEPSTALAAVARAPSWVTTGRRRRRPSCARHARPHVAAPGAGRSLGYVPGGYGRILDRYRRALTDAGRQDRRSAPPSARCARADAASRSSSTMRRPPSTGSS